MHLPNMVLGCPKTNVNLEFNRKHHIYIILNNRKGNLCLKNEWFITYRSYNNNE